jgi:hypothetical protein
MTTKTTTTTVLVSDGAEAMVHANACEGPELFTSASSWLLIVMHQRCFASPSDTRKSASEPGRWRTSRETLRKCVPQLR